MAPTLKFDTSRKEIVNTFCSRKEKDSNSNIYVYNNECEIVFNLLLLWYNINHKFNPLFPNGNPANDRHASPSLLTD